MTAPAAGGTTWYGINGTTTSGTITYTTSVGGENLAFLVISAESPGSTPVIASVTSANLTWVRASTANSGTTFSGRFVTLESWYAVIGGTPLSNEVVTITTAAVIDDMCFLGFCISGAYVATVVDATPGPVSAVATGGSGNVTVTGWGTSGVNELVLYMDAAGSNNTGGVPSGSGWNLIISHLNGGGTYYASASVSGLTQNAVISGQSVTGTMPNTADAVASVVAIRSTAAGYPAPTLSGSVVPPLTADLTWTSSGSGGDPNWAGVGLLLPFDALPFVDVSANALTVTNSGTTLDTTLVKFGAGSAAHTGYGNRVYVASTSGGPIDITSGDFTIEFWLAVDTSGGTQNICLFYDSGSSSIQISFQAPSSVNPAASVRIGGTQYPVGTSTTALTPSTFVHLALARVGNTFGFWQDGVSIGTLTQAGSIDSYDTCNVFGGTGFAGPTIFGNMDEFRITKGVSRYTPGTNFTPPSAAFPVGGAMAPPAYNLYRDGTLLANLSNTPTEVLSYDDTVPGGTSSATYTVAAAGLNAPGDPDWTDVGLLLQFDGTNGQTTTVDSSANALTVTLVGPDTPHLDTSNPKFGSAALSTAAYNGSDYASVPVTTGGPLDLSSGPWTIEFWLNPATLSGTQTIFGIGGYASSANGIYIQTAGSGLNVEVFGTSVSTTLSIPTCMTVGQYTAIALVSDGTNLHLYANGVQDGGGTTPVPASSGWSGSCNVGGATFGNSTAGALTDEFRITKGVARYTASYTPATVAFPVGSGGSGADESPLSNPYVATFVAPVLVPNVVGDTQSAATIAIINAGFVVGTVSTIYSNAAPAGIIIGQTPTGGTLASPGSAIALVKSLGPAPIIVPDLTGLTQAQANAALVAVGLVSGGVSSGASAYPAGEVFQQSPAAGSSVAEYSLVAYVLSNGFVPPSTAFDWEATVISQYANSPTILQLCANMGQYFDERANMAEFFEFVWNVNTAVGFGLDIWGRIVDISRLLELPDSFEYFGFHNNTVPPGVLPFNQGVFNTAGGAATNTYLLPDDAYRTLILVKALANVSATTAPAINQLLKNLFPGRGQCYVEDDGGMAMTFKFNFVLTPTELAILGQSGALPHPAGVSVSIVSM